MFNEYITEMYLIDKWDSKRRRREDLLLLQDSASYPHAWLLIIQNHINKHPHLHFYIPLLHPLLYYCCLTAHPRPPFLIFHPSSPVERWTHCLLLEDSPLNTSSTQAVLVSRTAPGADILRCRDDVRAQMELIFTIMMMLFMFWWKCVELMKTFFPFILADQAQ